MYSWMCSTIPYSYFRSDSSSLKLRTKVINSGIHEIIMVMRRMPSASPECPWIPHVIEPMSRWFTSPGNQGTVVIFSFEKIGNISLFHIPYGLRKNLCHIDSPNMNSFMHTYIHSNTREFILCSRSKCSGSLQTALI